MPDEAKVEVHGGGSAAFGVVFLPELMNGAAADKQSLLLPLTLAYLLSLEMRFRLPLHEHSLNAVESVFDQVLRENRLDSLGIVYVLISGAAQAAGLLRDASLIVTTETGACQAQFDSLPLAVVGELNGAGSAVRLSNLEKLGDRGLREKLLACAELVNTQLAGITSEGNFWLSW